MDDKTRTELEAAVYRRLVDHLRTRTDVQNIDLMNLAGFCRNCLSNWMKDAADAKGLPMSKDESREIVYGEPYDQWRAKHQKEATAEQKAASRKLRTSISAISKSGYRFCVRSRANLFILRMILSANRLPLRRIMRELTVDGVTRCLDPGVVNFERAS